MWLFLLVVIVGTVYLSSMQGITCCNSGSSFALVRAIVEKGKLEISEFIKYTKFLDYAKVKNKYYTDRPPGLAFVAVPFHFFRLNVTLVAAISGILSSVFVYLITLSIINSAVISFFTALIFAFCTLNWRYSTIFIIHPLSTLLILISVFGILNSWPVLLIGLILGISTIVEYTNFVFLFGIILFEIIYGNFVFVLTIIIGYLLGIVPLLIYNKTCFGSPFTTSYKYSAHFKWSNSPKTTFVTPMLKGIRGLLFYMKKKRGIKLPGGILIASPVLIFGIIGYIFMPLKTLILFLCLTIPLFLLISKHKTYWGGGAGDYRYISSIIPYITIPIGLTIKNLFFIWPIILILALISLLMMAMKMIALTVKLEDIKNIAQKDSKKQRIKDVLRLKNTGKISQLVLKGIFIRKVNLENKIYN